MPGRSRESRRRGRPVDLGPLTLTRAGKRWRFTFTSPREIMLELPPDYEQLVRDKLERLLGAGPPPPLEMDLARLPAISSRQLGLLLALRQALTGRCDRLRLVGVSEGVRRLLDLTRTAQFFELD